MPAPRLSLSLRLTLWYGAGMLVLLALFVAVAATGLRVNQHAVLHQRLFRAHTELLDALRWDGPTPAFDPPLAERGGTLRIHGPSGLYVRLLTPEGRTLDETANAPELVGLAPRLPAEPAMEEVERTWRGQPVRSQYVPIQRAGRVAGWLEVSAWAWTFHPHALGWPAVLALALTVAAALGGGYALARRALRPVAAVTAAARRITARDLGLRLPRDGGVRDELTDLADTFNAMLERLEAGFARERRFTDHAAHELLTPLAALRSAVDVALWRARSGSEYREALEAVQGGLVRVGALVEGLLELARLDAGRRAEAPRQDWSAGAREHLEPWHATAESHGLALDVTLAPGLHVRAHAEHLRMLADNLLDNAVKYTPAGGRVAVTLEADGGHARLSVTDTGAGFDAATGERLFDRFFRADDPAVQARPGSGIGLSVVAAIARHYGGEAAGRSAGAGAGSTFTVALPLA